MKRVDKAVKKLRFELTTVSYVYICVCNSIVCSYKSSYVCGMTVYILTIYAIHIGADTQAA